MAVSSLIAVGGKVGNCIYPRHNKVRRAETAAAAPCLDKTYSHDVKEFVSVDDLKDGISH